MADLEAVLADVSYLMAMEKSKTSVNSVKNGRRLTLPDRDSANVIKRLLSEQGKLNFDQVFGEKIGNALFVQFCSKKHHYSVPIVFYQQIEDYKSSNVDPEELLRLAKDIYDQFVMRELLVRQRKKENNLRTPNSSPQSKENIEILETLDKTQPEDGLQGFEKSADMVRKRLANEDEDEKEFCDSNIFDPFHSALLDLFRRSAWNEFLESDEFVRFCQWKNIELSIDLTMSDFSVHRIIGRGGFGEVFGCRKVDTGKMYAMKCLDIKRIRLKSGEQLAMNERKMLQAVSEGADCPFIVCMTYAFVTADRVCFVLDLMNGGDLHYHLTQHGCFSEPQVRFYAAEVALGLQHMHERHIVYRDLKPANILLCESGHAKISDLGLACDIRNKLPQAAVGTHGYMAPEVLKRGVCYSFTADWFSLGCMLYKLLRGHSPFRAHKTKDKREIDRRTIEHHPELPEEFSEDLKSLLNGLLNKKPHDRLGHNGASEIMNHGWFKEVDWQRLNRLGYDPPLIPPRGEVNAADAFDIGNFDDDEVKGIKLSEDDLAQYKNFPVVVSSRWQAEVYETIWTIVNSDRDRDDERMSEKQSKAFLYAQGKDIIVWGPCLRLGGPFQSQWQRRHLYLFPNRLEIGIDSDPHVWPLEEIIGIQETMHRSYRCIQIRLKSQKEFLIKFDSEPERGQWYRDLVRTWQEAQKLLKRGPKQISAQRSVKEEAKQKGAIILAQKSSKNL
jgi:beta-adrenergic-receptor kinase